MTRREGQRGSVTLLFVIVAGAFITMSFMVVEGGKKLGNISLAQDLASEMARVGAASLDLDTLGDGLPLIDQDVAMEQIEKMRVSATIAGGTTTITYADPSFSADGRSIEVRVKVSQSSWIPGFDLEGNGVHQASAIDPFTVSP